MNRRSDLQRATASAGRPIGVGGLALALFSAGLLACARPAAAQDAPAPPAPAAQVAPEAPAEAAPLSDAPAPQPGDPAQPSASQSGKSQMDLFGKDTFTVLLDARLVVANGSTSFVNGGLGKTRFQGDANGDFRAQVLPMEADLVWAPRLTDSLSANVSVAYQHDHSPSVDIIEAFLNYLPPQSGALGISARVGLMWPEISLEHSTGGAWSVVNTITPSAINSWVGEEVKVVGFETTLHANLGEHIVSATAAVFGLNDTSGTLLSFRGWAFDDEKATLFGHFPLPPLNSFIQLLQQNQTRSTIEIDHRAGYYGRLEWRPPWPFGLALFYYDNMGNPQAFTSAGQWGWRTRFWNLGFNADLSPTTKLLAQGMTGSTMMGFSENGVPWVDTSYNSAFLLVTQQVGPVAVTGRIEAFDTHEHGSEMPRANSENGWAMTVAAKKKLNNYLTVIVEAMNVRSNRGTRLDIGLSSPFEAQTVLQAAIRCKF